MILISNNAKFIAILFIIGFLLGSCKKHGCTDEFAVNYDSRAEKSLDGSCIYQTPDYEKKLYTPDFGPNTATLMVDKAGIETVYGKFNTLKSNYYLRARFKDANNNLVSVGDLEMKQNLQSFVDVRTLDKNNNHFYSNYIELSNALSMVMADTMIWQAQGDAWPSFLLENPIDGLPEISYISSGTPTISSAYTFKTSMVNDADSLSLAIHGQRGSVIKLVAGNQTQAVFSIDEMEKVGLGNALLRVMAMRYQKVDDGGQSYYFVNASRSGQTVRIQP